MPDLKDKSDEQLVLELQQGRIEYYDVLVERYQHRLFGYLMQLVRDQQLAEDLLQETFIRLYQHYNSYRPIAKFSTWIYTIATNLVRSHMRRRMKMTTVDLEPREAGDRPIELADDAPAVDELVMGRMTVEAVRDAMEKLPEEFRQVIILREIEELSYDEIVEILNLPLGTVKSRINRARGRLKELLAKDYRE